MSILTKKKEINNLTFHVNTLEKMRYQTQSKEKTK